MTSGPFDPKAGKDGKREGMGRAERHSDPHWWQVMMEGGKSVAERMPWFTTDSLEEWRHKVHPNATTHEHRALGPLMAALQRLGYCMPTDQWIESAQACNHRRPMRIWWSLLYSGRRPRMPKRKLPLDPRQYQLFGDDELLDLPMHERGFGAAE